MADIQVVSRVMTLMGRSPITSIESDNWGPIINAELDAQNRIILEARTWEFSKTFSTLSRSTTNSNPRWKFEYQLPSDFIRKVDVYRNNIDGSAEYIVIGDYLGNQEYEITNNLYTNVEDITLEYVSTNEDTSRRSATYIQALAYKAASELAPVLLEDAKMAAYYENRAISYLSDARMLDVASIGVPETWRVRRRLV